jgi:hypothetical protein
MSFFSSGREQNFLTTDDPRAGEPLTARYMLRKEGYDLRALDGSLPGTTHDPSSSTLRMPANYVLLMIGNTPELERAVTAARDSGINMIEADDGAPLKCYFVRVKVSSLQTDSLLAIASQRYWNQTEFAQHANDWSVPRSAANTSFSYVSTLNENQAAAGTSLLGFIRECKEQANQLDA